MNHGAPIASGRKKIGDARTVDEVQIRRARVLVEAERHLELAGLDLREAVLLVVHVDVAPGIPVVANLALNLIVEEVEDFAVDADATSSDIDSRAVGVVVEWRGL